MDCYLKLAVLDKIYNIYEDFVGSFNFACRKHCSLCCTVNVTMTTLEGRRIIQNLVSDERNLFDNVKRTSLMNRFQPLETTNMLAERSINEDDFTEEENRDPGDCPLLLDNECTIYNDRPFGCRCFSSMLNCSESKSASMDDLVLTVNNIFLQIIEHVDAGGFFGNLTDVLLFLNNSADKDKILLSKMINPSPFLVSNHSMKVLMIPPEHRTEVQPVLDALRRLKY